MIRVINASLTKLPKKLRPLRATVILVAAPNIAKWKCNRKNRKQEWNIDLNKTLIERPNYQGSRVPQRWDRVVPVTHSPGTSYILVPLYKVYVIQQDSVWEWNVLETQTVETAEAQALQLHKERVRREKVSTFSFI